MWYIFMQTSGSVQMIVWTLSFYSCLIKSFVDSVGWRLTVFKSCQILMTTATQIELFMLTASTSSVMFRLIPMSTLEQKIFPRILSVVRTGAVLGQVTLRLTSEVTAFCWNPLFLTAKNNSNSHTTLSPVCTARDHPCAGNATSSAQIKTHKDLKC